MKTYTIRGASRLALAVAGSIAAMTVAGCSGDDRAAHEATRREPTAVQTTTVATTSRPIVIEAGGLVQASTTAVITSRLLAPVRAVRVVPGDVVRAGQVLVVLDDRDLGAQARSAQSAAVAAERAVSAGGADRRMAEADRALARSSHHRVRMLHERRSATTQELDEATASLRAAEARVAALDARVEQAQASLASAQAGSEAAAVTAGFAVITAPFAGVIAEKFVEPGNMAAPGSALLRLEARTGLRFDVRLDAARVGGVQVGQEVDVAVDAAAPVLLRGKVGEIARTVDADARTALVKILLPADDRLRTGMFGRARLAGSDARVLIVPATSVVRRGQVTSVFVADGSIARLRLVVLGRTFVDGIEVTGGLSDGERVVTTPPPALADAASIVVEAR